MIGDLHSHSQFSDGSCPAEILVKMAASLKLDYLAISDHDSMESVRYAHANPVADGVTLMPATELTAFDHINKRRVHLLVYYPDDCAALQAHCDLMAERRNQAHLQSAAELEAIYPQFKTEYALQYSKQSGVLYKSGIMTALRDLGLAGNIYGEEYHALFSKRPKGRVLHDVPYEPIETVLQTIRAARGVVVMAHPSVYRSMEILRLLCAQGAIDGIEISHPRNTEEDKAECLALAKQYDLIVTGGTDFHGAYRKYPIPLGTCTTEKSQIERIIALAKARKA